MIRLLKERALMTAVAVMLFAAPALAYDLSVSNGPAAGGNSVLITNCIPNIGNGSDITNVMFGDVPVTAVSTQGVNWVRIILPAHASGAVSIVIQSESVGVTTIPDAYIYNPSGQIGGIVEDWTQWEEVAGLPDARDMLAADVLNGSLYAVGGRKGSSVQFSVYRFNGTNWTEVTNLPASRSDLAVGVLNGALCVVGGDDGVSFPTNVYRFNQTQWEEVAGLPAPATGLRAGVLNGALYAIGGYGKSSLQTNVYRFDGSNWTEAAGLPKARALLAVGVLNGVLYAVGGDGGDVTGAKANMYCFNGTNWTEVAGLPAPRRGLAAGVLNGALYAVGGETDYVAKTNVYRFNGMYWAEVAGLPAPRCGLAAGVLNGALYAVAGCETDWVARTNVYRYPRIISTNPAVIPASGSYTGGYPVVITGTNLGNGADITNVTLCGVAVASIVSQSMTQVMVIAGASSSGILGDVAVYSISYGTTIKSNAFTYNPAGVIANKLLSPFAVAGGWWFSFGLKSDSTIMAWGDNSCGVTDVPAPNTNFVAIAAGYDYFSLGLKSDGTIVTWGYNYFGQTTVPEPNTNFVAVAGGGNHSLGLKSDGTIVAWGYNSYGQTTVPEPNINFVAVAAGCEHSLGLKSGGTIVQWGWTNVAVPAPNTKFVAMDGGWQHSLGLKSDGTIVAWGANYLGQSDVPVPNTDFVAVAAGYDHSLGLKSDGTIVQWGWTNVPTPNTNFGMFAKGITPSSGSWTGGYPVVIIGWNLCDGTDVTNVTLCGVNVAGIISKSSTQIVVVAGMAASAGTGAVRVFSTSFGETVKSNAFIYTGPGLQVLSTHGEVIANGEMANAMKGTDFGSIPWDRVLTNMFSITNTGNETLTISGWTTNGAGASHFSVVDIPSTVSVSSAVQFRVVFSPSAVGMFDASLLIANDATNYTVNLRGIGDKQNQTISFPETGAQVTTNTIGLAAIASSGLPVSFVIASGLASINGGTNLTFTGAGPVSIIASQPGDTNWNPATSLTNTFNVTKAGQTVAFSMIADQVITSTVGLSATASSGLTVSFSVVSGPGAISGNGVLTFTGTGIVRVVASQGGNALWNAAISVTNNVAVYDISTLAAPQNLAASDGIYADKVALTWSTVSGAGGYQVWRAGANNSAAAVNQGNVPLSSYDDNSSAVRSATVYYYWVKAWNSVATSDFSKVDSGFCRLSETDLTSGQPMVGDYDGDRKADPAVYNLANGRLAVWLSSANYVRVTSVLTFQVAPGDLPVAGDFDGDRFADPGVFQRQTGSWYIWLSSADYYRVGPLPFGVDMNDTPIPADYDGDRLADPAICNAGSQWYVWLSSADYRRIGPYTNFCVNAADIPVPGQFDADVLADPSVYQKASGNWYAWLSHDDYSRLGPSVLETAGEHLAVPADYDGDGLADPAAYVPSTGVWRIWESGNKYVLKELLLQ